MRDNSDRDQGREQPADGHVADSGEPAATSAQRPPRESPQPTGDPSGGATAVDGPGPQSIDTADPPRKPRRRAPWWELPGLVILAIVIAILVKSFVIQPFYIPSGSMEKTLHGCTGCSGDRILVNKTIYDFRDPHPGDIVVFHDPPDWPPDEPVVRPPSNPVLRVVRGFGQLVGFVPPDGEILVKRVIAIGGQTVKGNSAGDVFVSNHGPDGHYRELDEPFTYTKDPSGPQPAFGPVTVPKGRLWVMGDHRTDSADSRYHCVPHVNAFTHDQDCNAVSSTVPVSDVIGKAIIIAWPPSRWRTLGTPATFDHDAMGAQTPGGSAAPGVAALAVVVPFGLRRRRRRRKHRR